MLNYFADSKIWFWSNLKASLRDSCVLNRIVTSANVKASSACLNYIWDTLEVVKYYPEVHKLIVFRNHSWNHFLWWQMFERLSKSCRFSIRFNVIFKITSLCHSLSNTRGTSINTAKQYFLLSRQNQLMDGSVQLNYVSS